MGGVVSFIRSLCKQSNNSSSSSDESHSSLVRWSDLKATSVKSSNWTVSGSGSIIANACLLQTRCYWEIIVLEANSTNHPVLQLGVSRKNKEEIEKKTLKNSSCAWAQIFTTSHDSSSHESGENQLTTISKGDVIGLTYDLSGIRAELKFYLNGTLLNNLNVSGIKGDVYPAVYLTEGITIQANFGQTQFKHAPPPSFESIILSQDLI